MFEIWTKLAPLSGVIALIVALILFLRVKALPADNARMQEIGSYIREGSMAFLGRELKILGGYSFVLFFVLWYALGISTAAAFLTGAFLSLGAGFAGMKSATLANIRTAQAAKEKGR